MYHGRFSGSHYDAGYKYGKLLREHAKVIRECPTFAVTDEISAFAESCLPVYRKYYPEAVDEIFGMADGQGTSPATLYNILFPMYCFKPQNHCTAFALFDGENILLGKNSDFLVSIEKLYMNCLYSQDGAYAFNANTTAFIQMEDGMNEKGLAAALTFLYPHTQVPGLNAGMLVRYILEKCSTTDEAINALKELPIASAQTVTLADKSGNIAVVECNCRAIEVIRPEAGKDFVVAANCFCSEKMRPYRTPDGVDSWRSEERYATAKNALDSEPRGDALQFAKSILGGKYGFICQYDRKKNADTVWSAIYDTKNLRFYRVEGNPARKPFIEDTRFSRVIKKQKA